MACSNCGVEYPNEAIYCPRCGIALRATATPPPLFSALKSREYAGFWSRYLAYTIDSVVFGLPFLVLLIAYGKQALFRHAAASSVEELQSIVLWDAIVGNLVVVPAMWLYFGLMTSSSKQATLGKMAMGLIVTDVRGERISFARASVRFFASLLSAMTTVGYLIQPFTDKRQALHDVIAETLVVRQ